MVYESRLELARILLADHDPAVAAMAAQPFQLIGQDGERIRRHVPDLLLVGRDGGVTVVDVKAASRLADPAVAELLAWADELVGWRGWRFEVWSGADRQVLDNVRFLAGYRRPSTIASDLVPAVLDAAAGRTSVRAVERALAARHPPILVRPVVLHLLWTGQLRADLTRALSADTAVSLRDVVVG